MPKASEADREHIMYTCINIGFDGQMNKISFYIQPKRDLSSNIN